MFRCIINSSDPKIIGVWNGVYQLEIDEAEIEKGENFSLVDALFLAAVKRDITEYNSKVMDIDMPMLKGHLLRRAKITDIMGFSPFFFGCRYVVSNRFLDCLKRSGASLDEYRAFPLTLKGVDELFYLFWAPMLPAEEINFKESVIYSTAFKPTTHKKYHDVQSYADYCDLREEITMLDFEKVSIPRRYEDWKVLNLQISADLFLSPDVVALMLEEKLTSFRVCGSEVASLSFYD